MGALRLQEFAPLQLGADGAELRIYVIYTTPAETRRAVQVASRYARDLGVRIEFLAARVVPYPRQLNDPTIAVGITERFFSDLLAGCNVAVEVKVLLCRDLEQTICRYLPQEALAVLGRRRRWGPGSFRPLLKTLTRQGHHIIVVDRTSDESCDVLNRHDKPLQSTNSRCD